MITTATDAEGLFSVDVFAKENGLQIHNREGIRLVSGKLLRGDGVTITWEEGVEVLGKDHEVVDAAKAILPKGLTYASFEEEYVDVRIVTRQGLANAQEGRQGLLLVAKEYVIGMGCKKGKGFEELKAFLERKALKGWEENTHAIATIDLKAREEGLWELEQFYHLPLAFFSGEELEKVPGDFEESNFVREITGVGNVCERAALCCAGEGGEILLRKVSENGMTLAMAKRKVRLRFD